MALVASISVCCAAVTSSNRVQSSPTFPIQNPVVNKVEMYYECCAGSQSVTNSIRSAVSADGGLKWTPELGARWEAAGRNFSAPRIVFLSVGRCRLYCVERGLGIISAVSDEDGLEFQSEPGVRLAQDGTYDSQAAFAPEILRVADAGA